MRRMLLLLLPLLALSCCSPDYPSLKDGDAAPIARLQKPSGEARATRVVVISIDGCRPDAIEAAGATTLKKLIERGAYCAKAETIRPSITLPSHTSMLTGLDFKRHGVVWNNYRPGYIPHPSVFSVVAQSGKQAAMIFSKDKFHFLANPACVSYIYGPPVPNKVPKAEDITDPQTLAEREKKEREEETKPPPPASKKPAAMKPGDLATTADMLARAFADSWPLQKTALTFVHFREADENGHRFGWMGPEQLEGIQEIDRAIARIVEVIEKNGGFGKTALIISADHGGLRRDHYLVLNPNRVENVTIPWICVGPDVPAGLKIDRIVRTYDTAPTALAFLGLGSPEGIDGKIVEEVLR